MFEKEKTRYVTSGIQAEIPLFLQCLLWKAIEELKGEKDYFQVFELTVENGTQIVKHTTEQPFYECEIKVSTPNPVHQKVYAIDDGEHCTMLLAEEY